jgi:hypothetical protein
MNLSCFCCLPFEQLTQVMSGIFCGRGKEATDTCLPSRPKSPKVSDEDDGCESRKEIGSVSNKGKSLLVKKSLYHKPPTGRKCKTDEDEQVCDKNDDSILPETMVTDLKKEKLIVTNNSMHANCSGASNTQFSPHHCYAKNLGMVSILSCKTGTLFERLDK